MYEQDQIDNLEDRIKEFQRTIDMYKRKQNACGHVWSNYEYDGEQTTEQRIIPGDYSQSHGSDYYPATEYVPVTKDRWTRTCKVCGKREHTYSKPHQ